MSRLGHPDDLLADHPGCVGIIACAVMLTALALGYFLGLGACSPHNHRDVFTPLLPGEYHCVKLENATVTCYTYTTKEPK